ncbi:MAG: HAMP domain-containing histidine kinase, partial [Chloroflexi bacterium]|nr:HAMP domain-containing histidine kinase [Chloroflexota bacterium]
GTLTVDVCRRDNCAQISVADTGDGITAQNLSRLFEPLFTTKQGGVGFGLALVKTIVERHGGNVEVKSEPGNGATFIVRLPLRSEDV